MNVFRITLEPYSHVLHASGRPARWNSGGTFLVYSAGTRSLACLENLVHRGGEGLDSNFRVMTIDIPPDLELGQVLPNDLPVNWREYEYQGNTRRVGDNWVKEGKTAVLKVPSAIIPEEFNYLLNPAHRDFSRIQLTSTDPFSFDRRL